MATIPAREVFGPLSVEDNLLLGAYGRLPRFLGLRGRALMACPKEMLLDEPSMGLAPVIVQEVFATLRRLKAEGTTMLLVEQFAQKALEVADHAYVMERGRIAVSGTPADLRRDERMIAAYLG